MIVIGSVLPMERASPENEESIIPAPPTLPSADVMETCGMYTSMLSSGSDVVNLRRRATVGLEGSL